MPLRYEIKKRLTAREKRLRANRVSQYRCCVNTSMNVHGDCGYCKQCSGISSSTKVRCRNKTCKDLMYCHVHLRKLENIEIRNAGAKGLGLFAKRKPAGTIIFRKLDPITVFANVRIKKADLNARYDVVKYTKGLAANVVKKGRLNAKGNKVRFQNSGPYTFSSIKFVPRRDKKGQIVRGEKKLYFDDLCLRVAGDYANDATTSSQVRKRRRKRDAMSASQRLKQKNSGVKKASVNAEMRFDSHTGLTYLVATRNIKAGEEILYPYGADYWKGIKDAQFIHFELKNSNARPRWRVRRTVAVKKSLRTFRNQIHAKSLNVKNIRGGGKSGSKSSSMPLKRKRAPGITVGRVTKRGKREVE